MYHTMKVIIKAGNKKNITKDVNTIISEKVITPAKAIANEMANMKMTGNLGV
jgi:hypothetical protein